MGKEIIIMKNNKKLWIGIGCGILVVALIVGIILMAGGNKEGTPTDPTGTTAGTNVTDPSDVTDPTDVTEDPILYPDDYDPSEAPSDPVDPDAPIVPDDIGDSEIAAGDSSDPDDDDTTEPTTGSGFSGGSYVGDSDDDDTTYVDPSPTNPTTPTTPTPDPEPEYDFTGITPGNITYAQWSSWDLETKQAWLNTVNIDNASLDTKYNYYAVTQYNGGYDCGYEGHYCVTEGSHNDLIAAMEEGCPYCGSHDCVSFTSRDEQMGYTDINYEKCPMYHNNCEVCGLPENGESGELICGKCLKDAPCPWCGEDRKAGECHHCIKP